MTTPFARPECLRCGARVGWVGVVVNLIMVILKVVVGVTAGSKACLADALHSSSNIVTAFAIFVSRRLTGKPADDVHTYGLGKVEFVSAGLVSLLILLLTLTVIITSFRHLLYEPAPPPHLSALLVACMSVVANELLFRYFRCTGIQLRSQTIIANAWANRADCFSSMAVVVGVVGAHFGFHHLDPLAALVVAAIIIKVCISCIRDAVDGLMDCNVPVETLKALRDLVAGVEDVQAVRNLKARQLGDKIWVDVAVRVAPARTVRECEQIGARVRQSITAGIQGVGQVQVDYEAVQEGSKL